MPWKLNIAIYQESAHLSSLDATHSYIWYSQFCNVPLYVFHECSIRSSTLSGVSCQHNVKGYWIILQFALGFGHLCCLFIIILGGPCPSYRFIWAVFFETHERGEAAASVRSHPTSLHSQAVQGETVKVGCWNQNHQNHRWCLSVLFWQGSTH